MELRRAKASDYEAVRDMLVSEGMTDAEFFTRGRFERCVDRNARYSFVAEESGKSVGFITGFDDGGCFYGYMGRLVVHPRFRRMGIASRLVEACLGEFRKSGVALVFFGIHGENDASKRLMGKFGAVHEGHHLFWVEL